MEVEVIPTRRVFKGQNDVLACAVVQASGLEQQPTGRLDQHRQAERGGQVARYLRIDYSCRQDDK